MCIVAQMEKCNQYYNVIQIENKCLIFYFKAQITELHVYNKNMLIISTSYVDNRVVSYRG